MNEEVLKTVFEQGSLLNRDFSGHEQMLMNEGTFIELSKSLMRSSAQHTYTVVNGTKEGFDEWWEVESKRINIFIKL